MDKIHKIVLNLTTQLQQRKLLITTAESCTGGLIASYLTDLPGSSTWFDRGFVTYSNLSKQEMLGIDEILIEEQGAVSEKTARAMALGALEHSTADVSLSVTGIAGPTGGSLLKPVGTVYFAWCKRNGVLLSECHHFLGTTRQEIRQLACIHALEGMVCNLSM